MFCNLYSHECDELGGSHLGPHTQKGHKVTSTHWKVLGQAAGATLMVKCPSKLRHSVLMFVLLKLSRL